MPGRSARAFGIDLSVAMLAEAAKKNGLGRRLIRADMNRMPFRDSVADIAICSMAIGYIPSVADLFRELARVSQRVIVSDLHPDAVVAGWRRSFAAAGRHYEIEQFAHTPAQLDVAAGDAGLRMEWRITAHLGEPEREIFARAGREHAFTAACHVPAILCSCWTRS
jgi:SAM-dependent methyltransferase